MERCPTCRARLRSEPVCPRCGTDLAFALEIQAAADSSLRQAIGQLGEGKPAQAILALQESLRLKRNPLALHLLDFLSRAEPEPAKQRTPLKTMLEAALSKLSSFELIKRLSQPD